MSTPGAKSVRSLVVTREPIMVNKVDLSQIRNPTYEPAFSGSGSLTICTRCYPMFSMTDRPLHNGDIRHGTIVGRYADVFEHGVKLPLIEQAIYMIGVPGLVLREFVSDDGGCWHRCAKCNTVSLVRLRYAPEAVLVFSGLPDHLREFVPIGVSVVPEEKGTE